MTDDAVAAALRDDVDLARIDRDTIAFARATVRPVHAVIRLRPNRPTTCGLVSS